MKHLQRRLVRVAAAVAVVALAALPTGANASLIGDTITITSESGAFLTPPTSDLWTDDVVVGGGVEMLGVADPATFVEFADTGTALQHTNAASAGNHFPHLFAGDFYDIGANSITINYVALGGLGFPYAFITTFEGLDWVGPDGPGTLVSVMFDPDAFTTGGLQSGAQANVLSGSSFQFQGTVDLVNGANFTMTLNAVHTPPSVVPIPAALPLFLSALAGLGLVGWRRRQADA